MRDVQFALRMIVRNAGFTILSIMVLALGVGATTTIFSIVNAVLLRPLPYEKPEELVLFWETDEEGLTPLAQGGFHDWRERADVFAALSAFRNGVEVLTGRGAAEKVPSMYVSANLLPNLGVSPMLGRGFAVGEDQQGADPVVLLTHGFWQRRFGAKQEIIGQTLNLDGNPFTVIGVLPREFLFPPPIHLLGNLYEFRPQMFLPLVLNLESRGNHNTFAVGRLKPGLSIERAEPQLQPMARQLAQQYPRYNYAKMQAVLLPLHEQGVSQSRTALFTLSAAVGLILLIACFNVANLFLTRALARFKEIAIRSALGAGRGQIVRQLLVESFLLALAGGVVGVLLSFLSLRMAVQIGAGQIPLLNTVAIDGPVLLFTLAVVALTALIFGLVPALQVSKPRLSEALKEGARGGSSGLGRQRFRTAMVVAEVAFAVLLLVSAGLLLNGYFRLQRVDLGFQPEDALAVSFQLPAAPYPTWNHVREFFRNSMQEIQSLPGIQQVGAINYAPLSGSRRTGVYNIEGELELTEEERGANLADYHRVSLGYFETMRIPLLQGRLFSRLDREDSQQVCLISKALAQRHWPGGSAVGARLTTSDDPNDPDSRWYPIVGVVGDVKNASLERPPQAALYFPMSQRPSASYYVVARTSLQLESFSAALIQRLANLDPDLPISVRPYQSFVSNALSGRRSPTVLMGILASLALILALGGLFGVMTQLVGQRSQEIGVRMALGAEKRDIARLIGGQTFWLVSAGLLLGLAGALAVSRYLSGLLYEVSPNDPATFAAAALLFGLVAALAGYLAVRKAYKVNPLEALRAE
ncbi:MAG: ABC transporter permease [Acidobacteriota bacterium]